ncbi:MAG: FlgD immunoglobulin-like domain containing protein, partial [bacterium]
TGKRFIPATGNAGTKNIYILNAAALVNGTKYYWKVQAIDNVFAGSTFSSPDSFTVGAAKTASFADTDSVAVTQQSIPQEFALSPNYPNPFNPSTRLNLNLPENGRVVAVVYDLTGQEVARLHDSEMAAGYKFLNWDGRNAAGTVASNGAYFVKVIFEGESGARKESTSRVLLLK